MKTFARNFAKELVCTITAEDNPSEGTTKAPFEIKWSSGPPHPESIYRPWRAWVNSIYQQLATEWNVRLFDTHRHGGETEEWMFEPRKLPKRLTEKQAKILKLSSAVDFHGGSAVNRNVGNTADFIDQVLDFKKAIGATHDLEDVVDANILKGPKTVKLDKMEGKTRIRINMLDSEIIPNLPAELTQGANDPSKTDQNLVVIKSVKQGWVKAWFRQKEIDPKEGRWTYYEVETPFEELKLDPTGQSGQAYSRMLSLMLGMAEATISNSSHGLIAQLIAYGCVIPGRRNPKTC